MAATRLTFDEVDHAYMLDGEPVKSVTTMLNMLGKFGLVKWASRITADYAVRHWDDLGAFPPDERYEIIMETANRTRDVAAADGTQIHEWAELLLGGHPVDVPSQHVAAVEGFAKFWESAGFEATHTERRVWSPADGPYAAYAGTLDLIARDREGAVWLLDHKTGKGVYPDVGYQLAGYSGARWIQIGEQDFPMPPIDRWGVLHIRPDGTSLHEVQRRPDASARWLMVREWHAAKSPGLRRVVV